MSHDQATKSDIVSPLILSAWVEPEVQLLAAETSEALLGAGGDGGTVEASLS